MKAGPATPRALRESRLRGTASASLLGRQPRSRSSDRDTAVRSSAHGPTARTPGRRSLPRPAGAVRDEVRPRDDARARRRDGPPRARLPVAARRRHERQGLGRGLLRRGAARVGPAHRPLHLAPPRARERADHRRRARDHRPRLRDRGARGARRGRAPRAPRGPRGAPDLLRGDDRRRLRALPPQARGRGRPRGGPRRPARRDERRGAPRLRRSSASTSTTRCTWAGRSPRSRARRRACCARGGRP